MLERLAAHHAVGSCAVSLQEGAFFFVNEVRCRSQARQTVQQAACKRPATALERGVRVGVHGWKRGCRRDPLTRRRQREAKERRGTCRMRVVDGLTSRTMAMAAPALLRWLAATPQQAPRPPLSANPRPPLNQHEARLTHCEGQRADSTRGVCTPPHHTRVPCAAAPPPQRSVALSEAGSRARPRRGGS